MDQSRFLAEYLRQSGPAQAQTQGGFSLEQMADVAKRRKAFEAENPGQSYMMHGLREMGANIAGAPQALMAAPGNVMSGLASLPDAIRARR